MNSFKYIFLGRLLRCIRCPTAYHTGDFCVAAGSKILSGNSMICSKHFTPIKAKNHHQKTNVSWCFQCSKGEVFNEIYVCPLNNYL